MKYLVLLGDGMADDPQESLSGKTPLEAAHTPNLDRIADCGELGLVRTVPEGMEPGSDVANMAILGYEPEKYYAGRAAIEAAALGLHLAPGQAAFRMNLVTLGGDDNAPVMADYSGGHPQADEQTALVELLTRELGSSRIRFVPGVSFRNLCIVDGFEGSPDLKPPHDHAGKKIKDLQPKGGGADLIIKIQDRARELFSDHPVNRARTAAGKAPINGVWLWGMGRSKSMPSFQERHGKTGAVVTGVDLVRGLARLMKLEIIHVPGATGYVDTDFEGKAIAVLDGLSRVDFVFLHVEAPDEAGHEGDLDLKVKAIEDFDQRAVANILAGLSRFADYRVLLLPDHETPVKEKGHRGGLVPYAVASRNQLANTSPRQRGFSEPAARAAASPVIEAPALLESRLFS